MKVRKTLAIKKESDNDLVNKKASPKARISMKAIMKKQQESVDLNSVQTAAKNKFKILFKDIKDGKLATLKQEVQNENIIAKGNIDLTKKPVI
jgi:hypothetical protein